eukprot:CAMPEP_0206498120 /NCGR_PEP_ID=MMETSP0324_2-20121206/50733_1 /ASSEMBLY_ACC=CAM_ASM_000836 /TAXON_ID=2866 /ORGANISM="Crypthecodinium cohnii, Strain Seligo" /LENGTH=138 /DNA_ID=CAMNT_0053984103 /DNA_START=459 /DNA_END=875 /DNA_ORIENTATION=+
MPTDKCHTSCEEQKQRDGEGRCNLRQCEAAKTRYQVQAAPENAKSPESQQEVPPPRFVTLEGEHVVKSVRPMHTSQDCQDEAWEQQVLHILHHCHHIADRNAVPMCSQKCPVSQARPPSQSGPFRSRIGSTGTIERGA